VTSTAPTGSKRRRDAHEDDGGAMDVDAFGQRKRARSQEPPPEPASAIESQPSESSTVTDQADAVRDASPFSPPLAREPSGVGEVTQRVDKVNINDAPQEEEASPALSAVVEEAKSADKDKPVGEKAEQVKRAEEVKPAEEAESAAPEDSKPSATPADEDAKPTATPADAPSSTSDSAAEEAPKDAVPKGDDAAAEASDSETSTAVAPDAPAAATAKAVSPIRSSVSPEPIPAVSATTSG
jgi:hypothetical protein